MQAVVEGMHASQVVAGDQSPGRLGYGQVWSREGRRRTRGGAANDIRQTLAAPLPGVPGHARLVQAVEDVLHARRELQQLQGLAMLWSWAGSGH